MLPSQSGGTRIGQSTRTYRKAVHLCTPNYNAHPPKQTKERHANTNPAVGFPEKLSGYVITPYIKGVRTLFAVSINRGISHIMRGTSSVGPM